MADQDTPSTTDQPVVTTPSAEEQAAMAQAKRAVSFGEQPVVEDPVKKEEPSGEEAGDVEEETPDTETLQDGEEGAGDAGENDRAKQLAALGQALTGKKPAAERELVPKAVEDWARAKKIDLNEIQGLPTVKAQIQEKDTEIGKLTAKLDRYTKLMERYPQLGNAIIAADEGDEDWAKKITAYASNIDYTKKFEEHDKKKITQALGSEKINASITEEQWEEYARGDADDATKNLIEASYDVARTKYEPQSKEVTGFRTQKQQAYQEIVKKRTETRTASINQLVTKVGKPIQPFVKELTEKLTPQGVLSEFFNEDGTSKPEAADKLMSITLQREIVDPQQKQAVRRAEEKAIKDQIRRTPEMPAGTKSGTTKQKSREQEARELARKAVSFG